MLPKLPLDDRTYAEIDVCNCRLPAALLVGSNDSRNLVTPAHNHTVHNILHPRRIAFRPDTVLDSHDMHVQAIDIKQ